MTTRNDNETRLNEIRQAIAAGELGDDEYKAAVREIIQIRFELASYEPEPVPNHEAYADYKASEWGEWDGDTRTAVLSVAEWENGEKTDAWIEFRYSDENESIREMMNEQY